MRPFARPLLRLLCVAVAWLVLTPVAASAMIEPYAPYQPQTSCSPDAKPGTLRLSQWLQKQYPGSGSLGISRSCKDGGVSEHKEGRAFDWAVSVHSARDRGYVADLFKRLFATDAEGNEHALARRMGIMYLIWNDHIYSSYYGFSTRDYRACTNLSACSDTARHRNHVHISLSRDGGAGRTSWYTGASTTPTPAETTPLLDLGRTPYVSLDVRTDGTPTVTPFRLVKGTSYAVTAAGLYGYGAPADVADASCRWSSASRTWLPYPTKTVATRHGSLNLRVDGARISAASCHPDSHVYRTTVTPTTSRTLRLDVANKGTAGGTLRVVVSAPGTDVGPALPAYPDLAAAPAPSAARSGPALGTETVTVPASVGSAWTAGSVQRGATYRLTVAGTAVLGGGASSDGRCTAVAGRWYRQASLDRRVPSAAHGRLFVDGVRFDGAGATADTCATRTHTLTWTATRTSRLQLALWDPLTRDDDTGALSVTVRRLTPLPTTAAAPRQSSAVTADPTPAAPTAPAPTTAAPTTPSTAPTGTVTGTPASPTP
jgi:hypothetical protein